MAIHSKQGIWNELRWSARHFDPFRMTSSDDGRSNSEIINVENCRIFSEEIQRWRPINILTSKWIFGSNFMGVIGDWLVIWLSWDYQRAHQNAPIRRKCFSPGNWFGKLGKWKKVRACYFRRMQISSNWIRTPKSCRFLEHSAQQRKQSSASRSHNKFCGKVSLFDNAKANSCKIPLTAFLTHTWIASKQQWATGITMNPREMARKTDKSDYTIEFGNRYRKICSRPTAAARQTTETSATKQTDETNKQIHQNHRGPVAQKDRKQICSKMISGRSPVPGRPIVFRVPSDSLWVAYQSFTIHSFLCLLLSPPLGPVTFRSVSVKYSVDYHFPSASIVNVVHQICPNNANAKNKRGHSRRLSTDYKPVFISRTDKLTAKLLTSNCLCGLRCCCCLLGIVVCLPVSKVDWVVLSIFFEATTQPGRNSPPNTHTTSCMVGNDVIP